MGPDTEHIAYIRLSDGTLIRVDAEDWARLNKFNWSRTGKADRRRVYAMRNFRENGKRVVVRMHRLIVNAPDGYEVDHINGDTRDNRKANLRICTPRQNSLNRAIPINNTSGYRGVVWSPSRKRWVAQITVQGKIRMVGRFRDIRDAARAYNETAAREFGEFARLNEVA